MREDRYEECPCRHVLDHLGRNEPALRVDQTSLSSEKITDSRIPRPLDRVDEILGILRGHLARSDVSGAAKTFA